MKFIRTTIETFWIAAVTSMIGCATAPTEPTMTRSPILDAIEMTPEQRRQAQIKREEGWKAERVAYVNDHPELSARLKEAITDGHVLIGMTPEQVQTAFGKGFTRNRSVGSWGVHEQWVFHKDYRTYYVYFENGTVTAIQDRSDH